MTIHALPGMGADHRMYPGPWRALPGFKAHDWPRHGGETTLAQTALSMVERCGVEDGDVVIGSSLGGMVACEMSKLRKLGKLVLVGSAVRNGEVSALLAKLHPLAQVAPIDWVRVSASSIPHDFAQMFSGIDAGFVRAMCAAIFKWEGLGATATPLVRIHGKYDLVIPPPEKADVWISGGHMISMTHADACVAGVRKALGL